MQIDKAERDFELRIGPVWRNALRASLVMLTNSGLILLTLGASKAFAIIFDHVLGADVKLFSLLSIRQLLNFSDVLLVILFASATATQIVRVLIDKE